jgi:hypothetical protein
MNEHGQSVAKLSCTASGSSGGRSIGHFSAFLGRQEHPVVATAVLTPLRPAMQPLENPVAGRCNHGNNLKRTTVLF